MARLKKAKVRFSALAAAAERGEATTITRYGRPVAVLTPLEAAGKGSPEKKPSFAELLLSIPHEIPFELDQTPLRKD